MHIVDTFVPDDLPAAGTIKIRVLMGAAGQLPGNGRIHKPGGKFRIRLRNGRVVAHFAGTQPPCLKIFFLHRIAMSPRTLKNILLAEHPTVQADAFPVHHRHDAMTGGKAFSQLVQIRPMTNKFFSFFHGWRHLFPSVSSQERASLYKVYKRSCLPSTAHRLWRQTKRAPQHRLQRSILWSR